MSWNFVRCHEILFITDAESFSVLSWKSFIPNKCNLGQDSSNRWRFAVPIFSNSFVWNQVKSRIEACYSERVLGNKFSQKKISRKKIFSKGNILKPKNVYSKENLLKRKSSQKNFFRKKSFLKENLLKENFARRKASQKKFFSKSWKKISKESSRKKIS